MINYFINWNQVTEDSYNNGDIFLWLWSVGAQLLPFLGVIAVTGALGYGLFRLWEERGL
jgi:hypothetical protein